MATGKVRIDYDSPAGALVLDATQDFDDGITAIVVGINAQIATQNAAITAQNAVEAAKTPPGPVTPALPLQTRNGYIGSLLTPIIDSTARTIRDNSVRIAIEKVREATKQQRQAFVTWQQTNIP